MTGREIEVVVRRGDLKEDIVDKLREWHGLKPAARSGGSTVISSSLDDLYRVRTGRPNPGVTAYRKVEALLDEARLTYDPRWDTSEHAPTGGSTVTIRPYSRLLAAVTGRPRTFLFPVDNCGSLASEYEYTKLRYHDYLHDAGPGSCVLLYEGVRDDAKIVAAAVVEYIAPTWFRGPHPWALSLTDVERLVEPVALRVEWESDFFSTPSVGEVEFDDWLDARQLGGLDASDGRLDNMAPRGDLDARSVDPDAGAAMIARAVLQDEPVPTFDLDIPDPSTEELDFPSLEPEYSDDFRDGADGSSRRRKSQRERDRLIEERAVLIARGSLEGAGWVMSRDRQHDGCGYDLEFQKGTRTLHVEVKGKGGPDLVFNLTAKERWRARTDTCWLLIVVRSALSPRGPKVTVVSRGELLRAEWKATAYSVDLTR